MKIFAFPLALLVYYDNKGIYPCKNYNKPFLELMTLIFMSSTLFGVESCPIIDNIVLRKEKQFIS